MVVMLVDVDAAQARPRVHREHRRDGARAAAGARRRAAGADGQRVVLPQLRRHARRNRRPAAVRAGQRPMGHPRAAPAARRGAAARQPVQRLRGGARVRAHRQADDAAQRPAAAAARTIAARRSCSPSRTSPNAEQAQAATAQLAAIVTSSKDAIISKDLDGVITSWNKGAEALFGYTAEEPIGRPVTLLIPEDRLDEEPQILERIRRGEAIEHYETVRRRKDGSLLDISLTVSPLRDASGRIVGASKIARDITERKRDRSRRCASARRRPAPRPTAARTSSWRCWRTSCATRWRRSATRCRSCG